jgi:hypothetical protein
MNKHLLRAIQKFDAAKPSSGFRPQTPEEWQKLQRAQEEFSYAIFRDAGMSHAAAKELAHLIFGGAAGMILLDLAFRDVDHE